MNRTEFQQLHSIFSNIVENSLGGPFPLPELVKEIEAADDEDQAVPEAGLRWLELLNLSVDPHLLRQYLKNRESDEPAIRALLRFLVFKKPHFQADREKADWLVTHVFEIWEDRDHDPGGGFGLEMERILEEGEFPPLSTQAEELLLEFPPIIEDITRFRSFSQITESHIIQRGRHLKSQFGEEFFHPTVLAAIVNYNLLLGKKMQELLQKTVRAMAGSRPAASQSLRDTPEVLQNDYRVVADVIHRFSELDTLTIGDSVSREKREPQGVGNEAQSRGAASEEPGMNGRALEKQMLDLGIDPGRQGEKLQNRIHEIAVRVRSNPDGGPFSYPPGLRDLSEWERRTFLTQYPAAEQSFRADFARGITASVGIISRIEEEMPLYFETRGAEHLWKQHCDALVYLLSEGRRQAEELQRLADSSRKRGIKEKSKQLLSTAEKLEGYLGRVAALF